MVAAEVLDEVARLSVAGTGRDCLHGEVGFAEKLAGFGHSAFGDPSLDAAPGLAAHDGGQVSGREPDGGGDRGQGDGLVVVLLDELEHAGQQWFAAQPQIVSDIDRDPGKADQQQRQVRECRLG